MFAKRTTVFIKLHDANSMHDRDLVITLEKPEWIGDFDEFRRALFSHTLAVVNHQRCARSR